MTTQTLSRAHAATDTDTSLDAAAAVFAGQRRRLFAIAYRVLGNWTEAEDVVQDVWLRWQGCDRGTVLHPSAFLATTATRVAINARQSARVRRETSVGDWPSEPVDTSGADGSTSERPGAVEHGIQLVLEHLTPTERAAYLLREAFAYPYARIAAALRISEVNARQIVSRAGRHIAGRRRGCANPDEHRQLLLAFVEAARSGDVDPLETLLISDLRATSCARRPPRRRDVELADVPA
jgi:RNA polymerase sigma-70 factor, ECF subfamily